MRPHTILLASTLATAACTGTKDTAPTPTSAPAPAPGVSAAGGSIDPAVARACPDAPSIPVGGAAVCTEMGCYDGYNIDVEPGEAWPAGEYRYVLELDKRTVTCTGSLPLNPCSSRSSMTCDGEGVSIIESGCALDPAQHAFGGVHITELPKNVHLRIEHDAVALVDQAMTVDYTVSQPNGPDCGPVCCTSGDAVSFSFGRAP